MLIMKRKCRFLIKKSHGDSRASQEVGQVILLGPRWKCCAEGARALIAAKSL